jgi:hypothetical protein
MAEQDKIMTSLLHPDNFYKLFFHWSWHVRLCFMYLFFFQMHRLFLPTAKALAVQQTVMTKLKQEQKLSHLTSRLETLEMHRATGSMIARNPNLSEQMNRQKISTYKPSSLMLAMDDFKNNSMGERSGAGPIFEERKREVNKEITELIEKRMDELYLLDNSVILIDAFVAENHTKLAQAAKMVEHTRQVGQGFNLNTIANCECKSKLLDPLGPTPTETQPVLSESQRKQWNRLIGIIKVDRQAYI